jgi:hypothetical protein
MTTLRGIAIFLVCLVVGMTAVWVRPAAADTQIFPIPSASTSKNDGSDAGLIVPILITDPDGELKYLMAPMVIKNSIVDTWDIQSLSLRHGRPANAVYRVADREDRAKAGLQLY